MKSFKQEESSNQIVNIANAQKSQKSIKAATASKKIAHDALAKSDEENVGAQILKKLAVLSYNNDEYLEIFNYLVEKITMFQYESKAINKTMKALTILSFLLRNGNSDCARKLKKQTDIFDPLNKIDSHYFEKTHPMNTKKLEYWLQLIKQRARYILMLLNDEQMLNKERKESPIVFQKTKELQEEGTSIQLRIELASDKLETFQLSKKKIEEVADIETENDHDNSENTKAEGFILKNLPKFQDDA